MDLEITNLQKYSDTEKSAYIGAIASIASNNKPITEDEANFIRTLCRSINLPSEKETAILQEATASTTSHVHIWQYLEILKNSPLRYSLLVEIISAAKADSQYTLDEEDLIRQFGEVINITQLQSGVLAHFVSAVELAQKHGEDIKQPAFIIEADLIKEFNHAGLSSDIIGSLIGVMAPNLLQDSIIQTLPKEEASTGDMIGELFANLLGGGHNGGIRNILGGDDYRFLHSILLVLSGNRGYSAISAVLYALLTSPEARATQF